MTLLFIGILVNFKIQQTKHQRAEELPSYTADECRALGGQIAGCGLSYECPEGEELIGTVTGFLCYMGCCK